MSIRIFIGGSQLSKFKSKRQIKNAKSKIELIVESAIEEQAIPVFVDEIGYELKQISSKEITVLSGHCPVGEERWYNVTIQVEGKPEVYEAGDEKRLEIAAKIAGHIKGMMGIGVDVEVVDAKFIARSEGKA